MPRYEWFYKQCGIVLYCIIHPAVNWLCHTGAGAVHNIQTVKPRIAETVHFALKGVRLCTESTLHSGERQFRGDLRTPSTLKYPRNHPACQLNGRSKGVDRKKWKRKHEGSSLVQFYNKLPSYTIKQIPNISRE